VEESADRHPESHQAPADAGRALVPQTDGVRAAAHSSSFLFEPVVAFLAIGVLSLLLRWAFGRGGSLVAAPPRPGMPDAYGLLVPVAEPRREELGEKQRALLEEQGIRATLTYTVQGWRLLVFPADADRARDILSR
jgi:hypothetical protein